MSVTVTDSPLGTLQQRMLGVGPGLPPVLQNHPTQSATTIDGWGSVLFGLPFLLAGVGAAFAALYGNPARKHAPDWLIGLIASFFFVGGAFFIIHGLRGAARKAAYQSEAALHPGQPWYADYHWHAEGFTFSAFRATIGRLLFALFWSAFLVPFFWIGATARGAWPFLLGASLFALIGLYIWYRFVQMLADLLLYGNSFLEYDQFPYFLGSTLNVRLRTPRNFSDLDELTLTLRCVTEKYVTTGLGQNRRSQVVCYELYKDQTTFSRDRLAAFAGANIPIQFPLPAGKLTTSLISTPPTYWEIQATGTSSKVNYEAYFLVPVYKPS
ncbi:MAG TPA: hypothetical protein VED66_15705 [Candidatus Sulfotelmatobacter sp.]|nr:hypothetical protein [Candidatus Sulfotelmatobacter sp.]